MGFRRVGGWGMGGFKHSPPRDARRAVRSIIEATGHQLNFFWPQWPESNFDSLLALGLDTAQYPPRLATCKIR